jgi:hypothetical protein
MYDYPVPLGSIGGISTGGISPVVEGEPPKAPPLLLRLNLDLTYPKRPNKFQDGWRAVIEMKAPFILQGMMRPSVLAFCPEDSDYIAAVLKVGNCNNTRIF